MLLDNPDITLKTCVILNSATLLPNGPHEISHKCTETTDQVYSSKFELKIEPLPDTEVTWFTDGSSFIRGGKRMAGYARRKGEC